MKKVEQVIKNNNYDEIKQFLTQALLGARSTIATKEFNRPCVVNILTYIDHMDKKIPGYKAQYEFLSEFSHPNSAGLNKMYSKLDWDNKEIIFINNHEKINVEFVFEQLGVSLEYFIVKYDYMEELLKQLLTSENQ